MINKKARNCYNLEDTYGVCYTNNAQYYFVFDLEDYKKISDYIWTRNKDGYFVSLYRTHHTQKLLHRVIMECPKNMVVDHINGNKYDNRKCNLRICTNQQNSFNKKVKEGVMGVYYEKDRDKWCAMLQKKQIGVYRERFNTEEEAIIARLKAEAKYFGAFAPQKYLFEQYGIE